MKKRGLKPIVVLILLFIFGIASFFVSFFYYDSLTKDFGTIEEGLQEKVAQDVYQRILQKDFTGIFEETIKEYPGFYNEETYIKKLHTILDQADSSKLLYKQLNETQYGVYEGDTLLFRFDLLKENESYKVLIPMRGQDKIVLEVPVGMDVQVGSETLSSSNLLEENVEASNFLSTTLEEEIVRVNIYELENCLGVPTLSDLKGNELSTVKDAITGHYLVGEKVEDTKLDARLIECAKELAMYPAQDTSLANVQEVSITSSLWYQRYQTLQNYWFTPHDVYRFSNEEVLHKARQDDDTIVAEVVFDYYAENEEVSRTWYIGYQMTFLEVDGEWKVLDIEINNELNPRQIQPE
ncbi:MAG: hypothetical protein IKE51_04675 [Solobacterium sp.]|nr:hypothetical protein [Solobacterium sp.]